MRPGIVFACFYLTSACFASRPQTPRPPFPYKIEKTSFLSEHPDVRLAATLTIPQGKAPFPAVLLISGSGPHDRDETMMDHKPFAVIADFLSRRGFAVLRFDDRGTGSSTGSFESATVQDFASDAAGGVRYLRQRSDIRGDKIGLLGHSEGGLIASIVAAGNQDVAFVVLLATFGASGKQTTLQQNPGTTLAAHLMLHTIINDVCSSSQISDDQLKAALPDVDLETRQRNLRSLTSAHMKSVMCLDPATFLSKIKAPVLSISGSLDRVLPPYLHLPPLRRALEQNLQASVMVFPGLNHLLQTARTGVTEEYETIQETIAPVVLRCLGDWLTLNVTTSFPNRPASVPLSLTRPGV